LSTSLVLRAPRRRVPFKLYITAEDEGKEYAIAYLGVDCS
jgi:hypothetical protein